MPNVVKIIIKDKFTNKLIALKLKEETLLKRVVEILSKRYEHLKTKKVTLSLRGDELAQKMSLRDLIKEKGYTDKERIEISEKKTATQASIESGPQDFIRMMSEGGRKFDQAIYEILVQANALHKSSAKSAMELAKKRGCSLITTLIEDAYLTEKDILTNVSRFLEIPSVDLDGITVSEEVMGLIPEKEAEYYCIIPIRMEQNSLCIAMPNPFDSKKLHDLRLLTGLDLQPELSTEINIKSKIKQFYQVPLEKTQIAPEDSPLPDELFSMSEPPKKKSTLMIKEGKIVNFQEVDEKEYDAPTLCGDKSEEFLPVEPEAESEELKSQESPVNEIWEAPTLIGRIEESPIESEGKVMVDSQDIGIAISIDAEPIDILEAQVDEPGSQVNIPPGGEIPVFAGFHPDEIPEAIEIVAENQDEENSHEEEADTDLMKTERVTISSDISVPAILQDEEDLLEKELEKELGISQEDLELEKAVRTEKIDPDRVVIQNIFKPDSAEASVTTSLFDSDKDSQEIVGIKINGLEEIGSDNDAPEAESAELSLDAQEFDLSAESSQMANAPTLDLSDKKDTELPPALLETSPLNKPITAMLEVGSDSFSAASELKNAPKSKASVEQKIEATEAKNDVCEKTTSEPKRDIEAKDGIDNAPQIPKTMVITKQKSSPSEVEPIIHAREKPDIDISDMVATRKMSKNGENILESMGKNTTTQKISRHLTARHYRKMYPFHSFPVWVIFSKVKLVAKFTSEAAQVKGARIELENRNTLLRVVPCIPGCLVVPHEVLVDVAPENASAKIWITPLSEGKIEDGKIEIWSGGQCLQTLSLSMVVVKQWPAKFAMILGMVTPLLAFFYDFFGASRIDDYPLLVRKFLYFLQNCATPLQGMFNLGLAVGAGLIFFALLLFFARKTRKAKPVTAELVTG